LRQSDRTRKHNDACRQGCGELLIPGREQLRTYAAWVAPIAIVFFAVYPTLNWITSLRSNPLALYVDAELAIPFIPAWIWAYLSMYPLFLLPLFILPARRMPALGRQLIAGTILSGLCYLLLPAELGFVREVPAGSPYSEIYSTLFRLDKPHNLVPSLHVVFSAAIVMACADAVVRGIRILLHIWLSAIVLSTLLVYQHHILDLIAAFILVIILRRHYEVNHE
jgi:membrane-associated phospholipid phosphatase